MTTIEQMDMTIARFMGMEGTDELIRQNYHYHRKWDTLMPVVEKIETLDGRKYSVIIEKDMCTIKDFMADRDIIYEASPLIDLAASKIHATFIAIYKFITWYNKSKDNDTARG